MGHPEIRYETLEDYEHDLRQGYPSRAIMSGDDRYETARIRLVMGFSGDGFSLVAADKPEKPSAAASSSCKPTNPKDIVGSTKVPMGLWPETATALGSIAFLNGALKYGRTNWRVAGVRASIYVDAAKRHIAAWWEGEEVDPDDGVPHLGAALACLAILVDARAAGKLEDDRLVAGGYRQLMTELTPLVAALQEKHKGDRTEPRHYTIKDNLANV